MSFALCPRCRPWVARFGISAADADLLCSLAAQGACDFTLETLARRLGSAVAS